MLQGGGKMIDYTKELYEQKKEIAALIRKIKKDQKNYALKKE